MQTITSNRTRTILLLAIIIVVLSTVSMLVTNAAFLVSDDIYYGVAAGEVTLGGMSIESAQHKLSDYYQQVTKSAVINITFRNNTWAVYAKDIELSMDIPTAVQAAYDVGRKGNLIEQLTERYNTVHYGRTVPLTVKYNQAKLETIIKDIAEQINIQEKEATLRRDGDKIIIDSEIIGLMVDTQANIDITIKELSNHMPVKVDLVVREKSPNVVGKDLADIDGIIASYTTHFDPLYENRAQNIYLSARRINNVLVRAGETFSFNSVVGPRLAEFGYKEAPVFINGKLVPDIGGGVCQVSSTLYNSALLADMQFIERTSHSSPPGYVPLGQDATVADNLLDFKFINNSPFNIYIASEVSNGTITVYIFGKKDNNRPEISIIGENKKIIEPNTVINQDPSMEIGKQVTDSEGQRGYAITIYRVKNLNGKEVMREFLYTDDFIPQDRIIRVGTKAVKNSPQK